MVIQMVRLYVLTSPQHLCHNLTQPQSFGHIPIASCSPDSFDFVKSYGAEAVFDYHSRGRALGPLPLLVHWAR